MADSIAEALTLKIIDYMKADSRFNSIKAFFVGSPMRVLSDLIPNCEVVILTSDIAEGIMGGRQKVHYFGQVRFWENYQDLPEVTDRVCVIESYQQVYTFNHQFKSLFSVIANRTLGGFSGTTDGIAWSVIEMRLGESAYGITPEEERLENWSNYAKVDFRIATYEQPA